MIHTAAQRRTPRPHYSAPKQASQTIRSRSKFGVYTGRMDLKRRCQLCGLPLEPVLRPGQRGGKQRSYCSVSCRRKADWLRRRVLKPMRSAVCVWCSRSFETNRDSTRFCSTECRKAETLRHLADKWRENNPRPAQYVYTCDFCSGEIVRDRPLGGSRRYHADCAVEAKRARYRKKTVARQSATVRPSGVSLLAVVERDGWACWLCGVMVDQSVPRTSRMGATVDHVVPLSKGGSDELENLRLAHWICNNKKSDSLVTNA